MSSLRERLAARSPRVAIILGSSLGGVADALSETIVIPYAEIDGFPVPKVSGHAGRLICGRLGGTEAIVLQGRSHPYESGNPGVMRPAIEALAQAGIEMLIITNAAGSLHPSMRGGRIMAITDHINFAGMNPLIGESGDLGFVPMTDAYDPQLIARLERAAEAEGIPLAKGVYVWFSGPSFETPAEIRMVRQWGGDAVGMSTVPEVILARRFGLKVAGLSVITNLAAGIEGASPSHEETKTEGAKAAQDMIRLLARLFQETR